MVMGQRLCVPDVGDVRREIMEEAHSSAYAMHPGSTKMYHTLKEHYWVEGYEEGYCRVRLQMSHMSAGKSRTSEACRTITVTPDPSVEMGENHYGFCGRTSTLPEWP